MRIARLGALHFNPSGGGVASFIAYSVVNQSLPKYL